MTKEKTYFVNTNNDLYTEWLSWGVDFYRCGSVVQESKELTSAELNDWYKKTTKYIEGKKIFLPEKAIVDLLSLRDKTVQFIKNNNQ